MFQGFEFQEFFLVCVFEIWMTDALRYVMLCCLTKPSGAGGLLPCCVEVRGFFHCRPVSILFDTTWAERQISQMKLYGIKLMDFRLI